MIHLELILLGRGDVENHATALIRFYSIAYYQAGWLDVGQLAVGDQ